MPNGFVVMGLDRGIKISGVHTRTVPYVLPLPAVILGTEWFCFRPVTDRIMFDHYERDKSGDDDVSGELRVSIEIRSASDESELALYRYITESGGGVIWSGTLDKPYDWNHLNPDTYPKTLRELQELCVPNG